MRRRSWKNSFGWSLIPPPIGVVLLPGDGGLVGQLVHGPLQPGGVPGHGGLLEIGNNR